MTVELWRRIESIYTNAVELPASERAAYLSDACGSDASLRVEIEALLDADAGAGQALIDRPAWEIDLPRTVEVVSGMRLGPYEVIAPIGAGGMGQVFRARDTRLQRVVAIKVARARFSDRFEREARAIAALNHPNICTLHDVGPDYLVMEHVEGSQLKGPLPVAKAIVLGCQILDALDAAHKRGIVHRDLKPANILVTKSGVKVLDFGLATQSGDAVTRVGTIAGTPSYMAPEQMEGREVDARADIYAFGCVMFEMLTGKRAAEGADALASVPPGIARLIRKCLERDPDLRWESARDLKTELMWSVEGNAGAAPVSKRWIAATAFCAVAGTVLAFVHFREQLAAPPSPLRFEVTPSAGMKMQTTALPVLSPDGHRIAFGASTPEGGRIVVQDLNTGVPRVYRDAVVGDNVPPPFWSPDGRYIAFSALTKLGRLDTETGEVSPVCNKPGPIIGGSWNSDGVLIFGATASAVWKVPASGGTEVHLTTLDSSRNEVAHQLPQFLPDGRHFLYLGVSTRRELSGIYESSLDSPGTRKLVLATPYSGTFVPGEAGEPGRLFWYRDGSVLAQAFDPVSMELQGKPAQVIGSVGTTYNTSLFAVSRDVLVYRRSGIHGGSQFARLDPKTGAVAPLGEPELIGNGSVSPDETRIAYTVQNGPARELRILDIARGTSVALPGGAETQDAQWPVWSPDSREIIYTAGQGGRFRILRRLADGSGTEQTVFAAGYHLRPVQWSADGRYLLVDFLDTEEFTGEGILPLAAGAAPFRISRGANTDEGCGAFSPDGKYLAYCSQEEGHSEVYVKPFIPNEGIQTAPRWLISDHGGRRPMWSRDSRRLYYRGDNVPAVFAVDIGDANGFRAGVPMKMYDLPARLLGIATPVTGRGDAIVRVGVEQGVGEAFSVVVNWRGLMAKR